MNTLEPFTPNYGLGSNVTASSTSAIVPVSSSSNSICITNTGANIAYIRTGVTISHSTNIRLPYIAIFTSHCNKTTKSECDCIYVAIRHDTAYHMRRWCLI